jgi:RHS repeat-associated protein
MVCVLASAQMQTIQLQADTSGYLEGQANTPPTSMNSTMSGNDVVPTINGELNVNAQGAMVYTIPIEVFKGVNNFQPNLSLAYNSDGGNGQAGHGWNIMGLSVITQGGKSKRIDGIYEGPQFDGNDPYYLDGQRLIQIGSSTDYQTELFSHIKIKKVNTSGYSFRVQYPDGKVAKYKEIVNGQHYIALIMDGYGNEIQYNYITSSNTPYIDTIKYGKTTGTHPFSIDFVRGSRNQPVKIWRNGVQYVNDLVIKEIRVSSEQAGLYRKYLLTHDITSLGQERLRLVNVENGQGDSLRPLEFAYNSSDGRTIEFIPNGYSAGIPSDSEKIGGVTMGDFYGDGDISSIYWVDRGPGLPNHLISSKNGVLSTYPTTHQPQLHTGKIVKSNGKFAETDQLIEYSLKLIHNESIYEDGLYFPKVKITIKSTDFCDDETNEAIVYLRGSYINYTTTRTSRNGNPYIADFNNDGLVDIIIGQVAMRGSIIPEPNDSSDIQSAPSKTTFIEIGKHLKDGGELSYQILEGDLMPNGRVIEFDGDGIPEILEADKTTKKINIYKFDFIDNLVTKPLVEYSLTDDLSNDTPLIFGDFNGDGLTDFITPERVFKIDKDAGITAQDVVNDIETSPLIWHQYISDGNTFLKTTRNFTNAKLAYCVPASSYHHIQINRSSFWQKLWSGTPDTAEYISSDFGASTVIPVDFNNDGKTDLASFKKFGRIKFGGDKIMQSTNLQNLNLSVNQSLGIDQDCYNDCRQDCYYEGNSSNTCHIYCQSECEVINTSPSQIVNHVVFHETIYDENNEFSFISHDGDESVPIGDILMSPYSFFINSQLSNGLESYQNKLVLYDPYTRRNHTFKINSDSFLENRISSINNNSGVIEAVQYSPLQHLIKHYQNGYYINRENYFYKYVPEDMSEPYPYYVHKQVPFKLIVSAVHTLSDEGSVTKQYRYQNAIQHLDGKGFLGFQKTFISDIYESEIASVNDELMGKPTLPANIFNDVFWTVNTFDPLKENNLVKSTYGGLGESYFTETLRDYQRFDRTNNRYIYININETSTDYLKGITITKSHLYNSDLLLESTNTQYDNVGNTEVTYQYQSSWSSGEHFYHGRINRTENTTNAYGDIFSTRDEYSSFNSAGIASVHDKYGDGTSAITTTKTFDDYGNITSETVAAGGVSPIVTSYDYDSTKRFITEVTNPEGLVATSSVNVYGWIEEEVTNLGATTVHTYDHWGNPLTSTDYLGITTTFEKEQLSQGKYSLSTTTLGKPQTIMIFDRFDRQIQSKTQTINNKWIVVDTEYDIYGKKIRQSEPYFEGNAASLWNHTEYDALDRPVLQTMYNGKVITTCYKGLTVTVEDDEQKRTKRLDAMGNTVYHKDSGGAVTYSYYANGTLKEANYDGIKIKVEQDGWGNKTKLDDPSAGIYEYEYDSFGRKLTEISPKGTTSYVYDEFGKLLYKNTVGDFTDIGLQYEYDNTTKLPTKVIGSNGSDSFVYETLYDDQYPWRIKGKKEIHPQFTYETLTHFDDTYGRLDIIDTQTMLNTIGETINTSIKNNYDNNGILVGIENNISGDLLWKIEDNNAKGLSTSVVLGNGYHINNSYDNYFLPENITHNHSINQETAINIDYDFDNVKGLLLYRNNHIFNKNESFQYDDLYRLTTEVLNGNVENEYAYDKRGRITHNTEIGKYNYNLNNYQISKLNLNVTGKQLKDDRGFADVTYNSYKKAVNIHLENNERINFAYNLFKERTAMYYGSEDEDKMSRPHRKYYSSNKAVEIKHDVNNNTWEIFTYLDGDPYTANVVQKNMFANGIDQGQDIYFLHRDYQATILAISDSSGELVEQRFFDAWGNLSEVIDDSNTLTALSDGIPYPLFLDRGYTGHEHLQGVGLIHMNGRLYDAKLRRFLSTDNFVQNPYNTQNFDRYAYVLNNPLIYTDPSGELGFFAILAIGVATAITANAVMNISMGNPWWYGAAKSVAVGAVTASISFGIGQITTNWADAAGKALFQAGAHGTTGGVMSVIEGGNFGSGFAAGAVSSLVSSGVQSLGINNNDLKNVITITSGGLSGGISSSIAGGNFWQGVRQGIITSGLNHVAHKVANKLYENKFMSQLEEAYGSKVNSLAEISDQTLIDLVNNVPILKKMYNKFSKEVNMYAHNRDKSDLARDVFVLADTSPDKTQIIPNDLVAHPDSYSKIQIDFYRDAFASYKTLAITMHHEFVHVKDYISGFIHNMYVKHGGGYDRIGLINNQTAFQTAIALTEVFAYWETEYVTGSKAIDWSGYQDAAAHLKKQGIQF